MSNEEALALIIKKYCVVHNISYSEFARETGVSRAYINRIISNKCGKFGISSTIKELIAKGLHTSMPQLEKQIEQYKNNNDVKFDDETANIISSIVSELKKYDINDLETIQSIISESNSQRLKIIYNLLKNMKDMHGK